MWRISRSRRGARAAPRRMRLAVRIALLLGLAVMVLLIAREGPSAILTPLARAGWVLLWLVPLHALPLLLDVLGWRALNAAHGRCQALLDSNGSRGDQSIAAGGEHRRRDRGYPASAG